jgi:hypothetical protein
MLWFWIGLQYAPQQSTRQLCKEVMLTVTFSHLFQSYGDSCSQEKGTVSHESLALRAQGRIFLVCLGLGYDRRPL